MRKLLTLALGTMVAGGCATPMERAEDICNRLGDPSPACVERQFNIERAREDQFNIGLARENAKSAKEPKPPIEPIESEYDRMLRQHKENCIARGGRWIPGIRGGGGCS